MRRRLALLLCVLPAVSYGQQRQDWPQFLGPLRDGSAAAIAGTASLRVSWRAPVVAGHSGIVAGGRRLFTMGSDGERDYLVALDDASGKEVWRAEAGPSVGGNEPSSTPAIAGNLIVAVGSSCRVIAADAQSGRIAWQRDLAQEYKSRFAANPGCGMSPLVAGARVILPTGAREGARLVSFDAATGATQWTADTLLNSLNGAPGFARLGDTPVVLYHSAKPPGIGGVSAVNIETGQALWHADMPEGISETTPVLTAHGLLLHGWGASTMFTPPGSGASPGVRWTSKELTAQWVPSVTIGNYIYGFGGNSGDFLLCVDAQTGAVKWSERTYRGHIARGGTTLVILSESSGLLRLVAADPGGYRELRRLEVLKPGARTRTPPSFGGGTIFVRNLEEVVAIEAR